MRVGETNPQLRRVLLVVYLDDGVTLAPAADASPPVGSLKVSLNGAAAANAAGSFVGDGSGRYYYELSSGEVATPGFVAFIFQRSGYTTAIATDNVGDVLTLGETLATRLRMPVVIYDDSSPPVLVAASVSSPSQLQTSVNGAPFANAAGSLVSVSGVAGLHYYQGVAADAAEEGSLAVKFQRSGFQTEIAWASVDDVEDGGGGGPTVVLTLSSPAHGAHPGQTNGFSSNLSVARDTPVTLNLAGALPNTDRILVVVDVAGSSEVAYYGGQFRGLYASGSTQAYSGDDGVFLIRRSGGWPTTSPDLRLTLEGVTPSLLLLELPVGSAEVEVVAVDTFDPLAEIDLTARALSRLPVQFRKPKIEALVSALTAPQQLLERAIADVLAQSGIDGAVGQQLVDIGKIVGQPKGAVADDATYRRYVRARIATNRSNGIAEDMIKIATLVVGTPDLRIIARSVNPATAIIAVIGGTDEALARLVFSFLMQAKSAAVRLVLIFSESSPDNTFTFDRGPGFDAGHLAGAL